MFKTKTLITNKIQVTITVRKSLKGQFLLNELFILAVNKYKGLSIRCR